MTWLGYGFAGFVWVFSLMSLQGARNGVRMGDRGYQAAFVFWLLALCLTTAWWVGVLS